MRRRIAWNLIRDLGQRPGWCGVARAVVENVRDPRRRRQLVNHVEQGNELPNPEAAKIYPSQKLRIAKGGLIQYVMLTGHAAFRADLRGITIHQIADCLKDFNQYLNNLKSKAQSRPSSKMLFDDFERKIMTGQHLEWDLRGLLIAFKVERQVAIIKTCFYKNKPNPQPPPQGCDLPVF